MAAAATNGNGSLANGGGAGTRGKPIKCKGVAACMRLLFLLQFSLLSLLNYICAGRIGADVKQT
jgi:hypothetical protein